VICKLLEEMWDYRLHRVSNRSVSQKYWSQYIADAGNVWTHGILVMHRLIINRYKLLTNCKCIQQRYSAIQSPSSQGQDACNTVCWNLMPASNFTDSQLLVLSALVLVCRLSRGRLFRRFVRWTRNQARTQTTANSWSVKNIVSLNTHLLSTTKNKLL